MIKKAIRSRITTADIIIIDECSMASSDILMKPEDMFRGLRHKPLPFGGMQIVFSRDLFQVFIQ